MTKYAAVFLLDNPYCIDWTYHYYIPAALEDAVTPGAFVTVPFGKGNRKQLALVGGVRSDRTHRDAGLDRHT